MDIKKPRLGFPVRGFGIRLVLSRRALTRTSVGNEKYEYEDENGSLAHAHKRGNQRKLAHPGRESGGAAVRHGTDLKRIRIRLSTGFSSYVRIC